MKGLRIATETVGARGLGRRVEPDAHLSNPTLQPWGRVVLHEDDRTISLSWARGVAVGLHSLVVEYTPRCVRIGTRFGTRPGFSGRSGYVVLRVIVEHTVIRLREPVRGRGLEAITTPQPALTHTS